MKPLPPADCEHGYFEETVNQILTDHAMQPDLFWKWMAHQTVAEIDGKTVVYRHDLLRYMTQGGPNAKILD